MDVQAAFYNLFKNLTHYQTILDFDALKIYSSGKHCEKRRKDRTHNQQVMGPTHSPVSHPRGAFCLSPIAQVNTFNLDRQEFCCLITGESFIICAVFDLKGFNLKTLWEKEKMLVTSIFSFSHNVFKSPFCWSLHMGVIKEKALYFSFFLSPLVKNKGFKYLNGNKVSVKVKQNQL